jgi:hypothetical protein
MAIDYKMVSEDSGTIEETDFMVPLPVIDLHGNFALTPKWFIRQSFDYFYIKKLPEYRLQAKSLEGNLIVT